jgi:hypothetical protein
MRPDRAARLLSSVEGVAALWIIDPRAPNREKLPRKSGTLAIEIHDHKRIFNNLYR